VIFYFFGGFMKVLSLICLFSLVFAFGCSNGSTPVKTITADLVTGALSTAFVTSLTCEATDVVKADTKVMVDKWFKLDQQRAEKGIVQDLCKTAISEIVPSIIGSVAGSTVPATWKCKLTTLDNAAALLSDLACKNITI
jgi:hypothetical protein